MGTSVDHVAEVKNATVPGNASEAQPSFEDSLAAESAANSGSPCECMASWEHWGHHSGCSETLDADYAWCRVEESCTSERSGVFGPWKKCEIACNCLLRGNIWAITRAAPKPWTPVMLGAAWRSLALRKSMGSSARGGSARWPMASVDTWMSIRRAFRRGGGGAHGVFSGQTTSSLSEDSRWALGRCSHCTGRGQRGITPTARCCSRPLIPGEDCSPLVALGSVALPGIAWVTTIVQTTPACLPQSALASVRR